MKPAKKDTAELEGIAERERRTGERVIKREAGGLRPRRRAGRGGRGENLAERLKIWEKKGIKRVRFEFFDGPVKEYTGGEFLELMGKFLAPGALTQKGDCHEGG